MLHGSGPELREDPTTRAVVNTLAGHDIAVLLYDKRGVGASSGDFQSASYRDFVDDALAATGYVAGRPDVDPDRVGLYTVRESGWFGPEIAVRSGNVRFIFNKVGAPLSVFDTVAWEVRNEFLADGIADRHVDVLVGAVLERWCYYIDAAADPTLATGERRDAINRELTELRRNIPGAERVLDEQAAPYDAKRYTEFAADRLYDATPYLRELAIPIFYAYGSDDVNVPTVQSVATLQALVDAGRTNIEYRVFPDVGHSLATWRGMLSAGFATGYLDLVGSWVAANAGVKNPD